MVKTKFTNTLLKHILPLVLGILILIISVIFNFKQNTKNILYILSLIFISYDIIIYTVRDVFIENQINENIFITFCIIATYFMKYYYLCIVIAILFKLSYLIKGLYIKPYKRNIFNLLEFTPKSVTIDIDNELKNELPENISIGNIILVQPNEIIPLDGIIVSGESRVDESKLTGKMKPRDISIHDEVLNGSINLDNPLIVKVTREFSNSTIMKIKSSISNGINMKSKKISRINKLLNIYITALIFIPVILLFSIPLFVKDFELMPHIITALNYVILLSPLAFVINLHISHLMIIKSLKKQKIYVRNNITLENLRNVHSIIIDESFIDLPCDIDNLDKFKNYILTTYKEMFQEIGNISNTEFIFLKHFPGVDNSSTTRIKYNDTKISIICCLPLPFIRSKILRDNMAINKNASSLIFIGNGVQNIQLLCMSDIGITSKSDDNCDMVNLASDICIGVHSETNTFMDSVNKLVGFSKHSRKIIVQNFLFCIIIKVFVLALYKLTNINLLSILFIELISFIPMIFNCSRSIHKD